MFSLSILFWIVIGGLTGLIARKLLGGDRPFGMAGDVLLGMAGGALGGFLLSLVGDLAAVVWIIGSVVTALLGAVLLIWIVSLLKTKPN
jgi:uncharacterized membrane protein YeaQ/YmgE (transglycosylase-associated protein family)